MRKLRPFSWDEAGAPAIEYGLIAGISVASSAVVQGFGSKPKTHSRASKAR